MTTNVKTTNMGFIALIQRLDLLNNTLVTVQLWGVTVNDVVTHRAVRLRINCKLFLINSKLSESRM